MLRHSFLVRAVCFGQRRRYESSIKLGQARLHNIPHKIHLIPQITWSPHDLLYTLLGKEKISKVATKFCLTAVCVLPQTFLGQNRVIADLTIIT